jgi:translocation and assembly module TamB
LKKSHIVQIIILITLLAAAAIAIWPIQKFVKERMEILKIEAISFLERTTGREIRYESVSPSILRFLEINKMRILSGNDEGDDLLEINRIRVYYNIFKLLGKNPTSAFSRISIEDSSLVIDLVKDSDLIDLLSKLTEQLLSVERQETNLTLSGRNMNLSIIDGETSISIASLFFDVNTRSETPGIDLTCDLEAVFPEENDILDTLSASLSLEGTFSRDMTSATLRPSFSQLRSGAFTISSQTFQASLSAGVWRLTKIQDRLPVDFDLTFDTNNRAIAISFAAADFVPESVLLYAGKESLNVVIATIFQTPVTGTGEAGYNLETKELSYQGEINLALHNSIGPFTGISFAGEYAGDLSKVTLSNVIIAADQGTINFEGVSQLSPIAPSGVVRVTDLRWPLDRPISGLFSVSGTADQIDLRNGALAIEDLELESLRASIEIGDEQIAFNTGFIIGNGGETGRVDAEGSLSFGEVIDLELSDITVARLPLSLLVDLAGVEEFPASLPPEILKMKIDAGAFIHMTGERYLYSVPIFKASSPDDNYSVSARIAGNNYSAAVSDLGIRIGNFSLTGETTFDIANPRNLGISSKFVIFETEYTVNGILREWKSFTFTGDYGLSGSATLNEPGIQAELHTETLPIPFRDATYSAALRLKGSYTDRDTWSLESTESTVGPVTLPVMGEIRAGFSGVVTPQSITAVELRVSDQFSELTGSGYLDYAMSAASGFAGEVSLENPADGESYTAVFSVSGEDIEADLTVTEGLLQRLGTLPVDGRISGEISVRGSMSLPDIDASLSIKDGTFAGDSIALSGDVSLDTERLLVENLGIDYVTNRLIDVGGSLDFSDGVFSFGGSFAGSFRDKIVTSTIDFSGSFDELFGRGGLSSAPSAGFTGIIRAGDIVFGDENPDEWVFDVTRSEDTLAIDGGPHSAIRFVAGSDTSFTLELKDPLPIIATARGVLSGGTIDADITINNLDMEGIESILVIPALNITSGKAYGNLLISGRLNDPDIYGELFGRELLGKISLVPEIIGPFSSQLSFKGKSLLLNQTLFPAGAAKVMGSAEFTLDHWLPISFDIQLATVNEPGIHIRHNFGRIDTDGYGHGELFFTGDAFAVDVTGDLVISNGTVMIGEAPPPSGVGPAIIADVVLTTGKKVVFLWPNRNVPILTADADTGQRLRIQTNPLIGSLDVDGDIEIRSGEVFYFQRGFRIREGSVLLKEDQNMVDPHITVRAESRDVTDAGEELRIYLVIENQPFSQFKPRFESTPPMSQAEVYAALGQNLKDELGGDFYGLSSALLIGSDIFTRFGIVRSLEQNVRDLLNLDLFSIRTHILQNVLSEQLIPGDTAGTPGASSVGKYLDNTTLFLGKYFGNDIFIEAMVRLRTNQALLSNLKPEDDLYVDSEIRFEWKTPLFLLELSLLPDILDPLSSIKRARLGLSWDFWY